MKPIQNKRAWSKLILSLFNATKANLESRFSVMIFFIQVLGLLKREKLRSTDALETSWRASILNKVLKTEKQNPSKRLRALTASSGKLFLCPQTTPDISSTRILSRKHCGRRDLYKANNSSRWSQLRSFARATLAGPIGFVYVFLCSLALGQHSLA